MPHIKGQKAKEFEKNFRENYSRLYYYALIYIKDSETCKDIVSDVFESVWEDYDKIKDSRELTGYMYSCIRNRCVDFIRHESVKSRYADLYYHIIQNEVNSSDNDHDDRIERISKVIEQMPARTRFIIEECFYYQKKYKEVAEILEITPDGVKKHIVKALKTLRNEFL